MDIQVRPWVAGLWREERRPHPTMTSDQKLAYIDEMITHGAERQDRYLDLSNLGLTELPDSIRRAVNVPDLELDLTWNELSTLPEWIGELTNLTGLNLRSNALSAPPDSIGELTNLTRLSLSDNDLTTLPNSFRRLINLTELDLEHNQIYALPEWIGDLSRRCSTEHAA